MGLKTFSKLKSLDSNAMITVVINLYCIQLWLPILHDSSRKKKNEKDFHSRPTLKSEEMVMEQLTYNDMQDAHSGTACLFHGQWEAKCWAAGLLMSQPLIHGLTFQRVWLFHLNFSSCNLFHHQDKKQEQQAINIRETSW